MNMQSENTKDKNLKAQRNFANAYYKFGTVTMLLLLCIISAIISPTFLTGENLINVLRQISVVAIIACGQTIVIISGNVDLSAGSTVALSGCIAASIIVTNGSILLAILAALAIGAVVGFINGFLISKFNVQAFIITLASMQAVRGIAYLYTDGRPIVGLGNFKVLGQGNIFDVIPVPVVIMAATILITWILLNYTKLGRYSYAIGGNQDAAIASGIKINRIKIIIYIFMGMVTALAGVILASRINSGQPTAGVNYEFDSIIAVIIGGTSFNGGIGTVTNTFIGALLVGVINNILNLAGVSAYVQQIVKGLIIAGAVILDVRTKQAIVGKK